MTRLGHSIKAALLQVHSIIGLALSLLLAVIALTGATMSFEDDILDHLNAGIMRVAPRDAPTLTPDELIGRVKASRDIGRASAIRLASDKSAAAYIRFVRSEDGARPASLYVDPYDGRVLGPPRGEEFFATVRRLHRWLLIPGEARGWGRPITGIAALGLIAMLISGLVLRWPRRASSVKIWLKPNLALQGRGLHRSLHAVIGTWVMLIYLVMTLTGLWYSFDWYKDGVVWLLSRPPVAAARMQPKAPRPASARDTAQPIGFDRAWFSFLRENGGRFARAQLTLPAGSGTAVRVRSWDKDSTRDGVRDEFRIDTITGEVVSSDTYASKTFGERIITSVLDIHRGAILGWPGKLLFMVAAGLMPLFVVTGIMLYLSRRRLRRLSQPPLARLVPGE